MKPPASDSIAPKLSLYITVDSCEIRSLFNTCRSAYVILVASDNAMYSASVELRVTPFCSALEVYIGAEPYLISMHFCFLSVTRLRRPSSSRCTRSAE